MIFGIKPSTLWSKLPLRIGNLLVKKLEGHQPEVLFSYPKKEGSPKVILRVRFNFIM